MRRMHFAGLSMNHRAIFFEEPGRAVYREIRETDLYLPTEEEQRRHGVNVITRPSGEPGEGEIQVEAVLGAICTHEVSIFTGELTVPRFPWLPGHEAVLRVTATGRGVTGLTKGDLVSCCWYHGQWSRRVNGPAQLAYRLPDSVDDAAAWIVEPAASVVNAVAYFGIKPGDRVLVIGAGFMGLLIVQLLARYPLSDLVVTEIKPHNLEAARRCGAMDVIDPSSTEGRELLDSLRSRPFDITVECSGSQAGLDDAVCLTRDAGAVCLFGWHRKPRQIDLSTAHLRGHRILNTSPGMDTGMAYERHWPTTIRLIERGVFHPAALVTHRYPVEEVQRAMDEAKAKPDGFIKGLILFEK